jgi:SAM-dependent methyltransferase
MAEVRDSWAAGSTYEDFMGRWSRELAPRFLAWLGVPAGVHWLDVGCGTGALTSAICSHADPASVVGCDPAEPFIAHARRECADARARFVVAGAGGFPAREGGYGSVTSLLALNFFPDPQAAVHELRSLTSAAGTVSACVWDYASGMEFLRQFWNVVAAMDSKVAHLDEGVRFQVCVPRALKDLFRAAGLGEVRCEPLEIRTDFAGFDDYWRPFLGGIGPAPSYVASLAAHHRTALARQLERALPRGPGGTIPLSARAWAVRGTAS